MSYRDVPIERISNVNKSCKVIEFNPPYLSRVKVPTVVGPETLLEKSSLVSYVKLRISINRE